MAYKEQANVIHTHLSPSLQQAMDLNSETDSSAWLTVLPLQDQGFHLHKLLGCLIPLLWMEAG